MNISKEIIVLLILALVIFGPSRLAGLGGVLGKTIRDFRKAVEGDDESKRPSPPDSTGSSTQH